jgi:hypothetical protein
MNAFKNWISRWQLRQIIQSLSTKTHTNPMVHGFCKQLEATSIMTRGMKKDTLVTINCEREELDAFIHYMTSLHDEQLSRLNVARLGLATLMIKDAQMLDDTPQGIIQREIKKTLANRKGKFGKSTFASWIGASPTIEELSSRRRKR